MASGVQTQSTGGSPQRPHDGRKRPTKHLTHYGAAALTSTFLALLRALTKPIMTRLTVISHCKQVPDTYYAAFLLLRFAFAFCFAA